MPELRHMLSEDSTQVLRAIQARGETPDVVDNMSRQDLYDHLAIRTAMGASQAEIEAKVERWGSMRDAHELLRRAGHNVRTKERDELRQKLLK